MDGLWRLFYNGTVSAIKTKGDNQFKIKIRLKSNSKYKKPLNNILPEHPIIICELQELIHLRNQFLVNMLLSFSSDILDKYTFYCNVLYYAVLYCQIMRKAVQLNTFYTAYMNLYMKDERKNFPFIFKLR